MANRVSKSVALKIDGRRLGCPSAMSLVDGMCVVSTPTPTARALTITPRIRRGDPRGCPSPEACISDCFNINTYQQYR